MQATDRLRIAEPRISSFERENTEIQRCALVVYLICIMPKLRQKNKYVNEINENISPLHWQFFLPFRRTEMPIFSQLFIMNHYDHITIDTQSTKCTITIRRYLPGNKLLVKRRDSSFSLSRGRPLATGVGLL